MIREPRRHFFNAMNEIRWTKEKEKMVDEWKEFVRGEQTPKQVMQETINNLNAAIDRIDIIIKEMQDKLECKN